MSLKRAHANMIGALAVLPPPRRIARNADSADVINRADHLEAVYTIVMTYLEAVMLDTVDHLATAGPVDRHEIENVVWDAINHDPDHDVVGALSRAGCLLGLRAAA